MIEYEDIDGEQVVHFFCDKCGKDIGEAYEYDDGYYDTPETVHGAGISWMYDGKWYELPGHFCEKCEDDINTEVMEFFERMGIVKER